MFQTNPSLANTFIHLSLTTNAKNMEVIKKRYATMTGKIAQHLAPDLAKPHPSNTSSPEL